MDAQLVNYIVVGLALAACVIYMAAKVRRKVGLFTSTGEGGCACCGCGDVKAKNAMSCFVPPQPPGGADENAAT
jgi:hypothetical protein